MPFSGRFERQRSAPRRRHAKASPGNGRISPFVALPFPGYYVGQQIVGTARVVEIAVVGDRHAEMDVGACAGRQLGHDALQLRRCFASSPIAKSVRVFVRPPDSWTCVAESGASRFIARHGELVQVELDALPPEALRDLYQSALDRYWDTSAFEHTLAREQAERAELVAYYWARLSGFGGTLDDIRANDNASGSTIVTISSSDRGFQARDCGTWRR